MNDKISRSCYHYQYPPVKYETAELWKNKCAETFRNFRENAGFPLELF